MEINIGIQKDKRNTITRFLNQVLADEYLLFTKTQKYHWNVTGPEFFSLHELMGKQYEQLASIVDELAERITSLGGKAEGTMKEFIENASLKEDPEKYPSHVQMVEALLYDHEAMSESLHEKAEEAGSLGDTGTEDMLIGFMKAHTKMAWMLRSTLEH